MTSNFGTRGTHVRDIAMKEFELGGNSDPEGLFDDIPALKKNKSYHGLLENSILNLDSNLNMFVSSEKQLS